jgi:hypothetical protein
MKVINRRSALLSCGRRACLKLFFLAILATCGVPNAIGSV